MEARQMARRGRAADVSMPGQSAAEEAHNSYLKRKWGWMTEGLANDNWTKRAIHQLCENQVGEFMEKTRKGGRIGQIMAEDTVAANIPDYVRFIFPVIRKVWANLIAPGLVSIQPMTAPVGGLFYWEYKYGTTKGRVTAGDNMISTFDKNYSSELVQDEKVGATANGVNTTFSDTLAFGPIKAKTTAQAGLSVSFTLGGIRYRNVVIDDGDGTLSGTNIDATASTINYSTKAITIEFDVAPDNGTEVLVSYFYNMEGSSTNVPQVNIDIGLVEIKAYSRKIRFNWSSEAADDMRAMIGMDVESELVAGVASEMSLEIDREIIHDCRTSGTTITDAFDATPPPGITAVEHYRNILTPLTRVSMTIGKRTKRTPGNWIVCGEKAATIMAQLETHGFFKSVFSPGSVPSGMGVMGRPGFPLPAGPSGYGVYQLGVLQNRWTVFVDPYFDDETSAAGDGYQMLIGAKGTTFVDAGYAYAPYVPMQVTPTFLDPADFSLRKGIRTRYAKKLLNADFYATVALTGV